MISFSKNIRTIGLLSISLLPLVSTPAYAGFEFLPRTTAPAAPAAPIAPQVAEPMAVAPSQNGFTEMPVLPAAPVTAQALAPLATQAPQRVVSGGALKIEPYPLQAAGVSATHHGGNNVYVEQAMLQAGGTLKGIAAPGANYSSRITNNASNIGLTQAPANYRQETVSGPVANVDATAQPAAYVSRVDAAPLYPSPAPIVPAVQTQSQTPRAPIANAPAQNTSSGFTEAVGFGRDLPLALALSQVVPADYSFSFAQNVDAGANVSWQGGKSWDQVLQDMLAPVGMRAIISGNQIIIQIAA